MPTYQYQCAEGHAFEQVQKMSEPALTKCPQCGAKAVRKISGGSGLIFKGSGFYITDYGKDGKGARKDPESSAAAPEKSESKGGDASSNPAPPPAKSPGGAEVAPSSKPTPASSSSSSSDGSTS